jgi:hypothetical protein
MSCPRDVSGASYGCVAAGGPRFTSNKDTTGTPGADPMHQDTQPGPAVNSD